jgi:hypothetical protein
MIGKGQPASAQLMCASQTAPRQPNPVIPKAAPDRIKALTAVFQEADIMKSAWTTRRSTTYGGICATALICRQSETNAAELATWLAENLVAAFDFRLAFWQHFLPQAG